MQQKMANGAVVTVYETLTSLMGRGVSTKDNDTCSALLEWLQSDTCFSCFGIPLLDVKSQNDGTVNVKFIQPYNHPRQPKRKLQGKWKPKNTYFDSIMLCLCTEFSAEFGDNSSSDDELCDIERSDVFQRWLND